MSNGTKKGMSSLIRKESLSWEPCPDFPAGPTEQNWVPCSLTSYKRAWESKYEASSVLGMRGVLCQKEKKEG